MGWRDPGWDDGIPGGITNHAACMTQAGKVGSHLGCFIIPGGIPPRISPGISGGIGGIPPGISDGIPGGIGGIPPGS